MKTDDFLSALAADTLPRPTVQARLVRALPVGLAASAVALALVWGVRADLTTALTSATTVKTISPVVLAALAIPMVLSLSRPDPSQNAAGRILAVFGAGALALFGVALALDGLSGLITTLLVPSLAVCLLSIPALALPILGALLWTLSAGAPLNAGRTGLVAGLAAGALSTGLYSLYCNQDSLLFFLPAYAAAIGFVAFLGQIAGRRALRW